MRDSSTNPETTNDGFAAIASTHFLKVLSKQKAAQSLLAQVQQQLPSTDEDLASNLHILLQQAIEELAEAQRATATIYDAFPKPDLAGAPDGKTFGGIMNIPELLEMILLGVRAVDILKMERVCKLFNAHVNGSAVLQRHMGLAPDNKSHYSRTMLGHDIFPMNPLVRYRPKEQVIELSSFLFPAGAPSKLSTKMKRMLICQPPLKEIVLCAQCSDAERTITVPTGITFGVLLDTTAEPGRAHRLCHEAASFSHGPSGDVNVTVEWNGRLKVLKSDPVYQHAEAQFDEKQAESSRLAILGSYVIAKRNAFAHGLPIPSLAEFKEAQAASAATQ